MDTDEQWSDYWRKRAAAAEAMLIYVGQDPQWKAEVDAYFNAVRGADIARYRPGTVVK